jgi:NADPH:quinone reductase-like Zn-dependent oxidoreductase
MNRALDAAALRPVVDRVFGFEELPRALGELKTGAHFGKLVLAR